MLTQPRNGVLNILGTSGTGTQPSLHGLTKDQQIRAILIFKRRIFQRAETMEEKAHLLV